MGEKVSGGVKMRSYFALQKNNLHSGGWSDVLYWAREKILKDSAPVKIFTARAGDRNARIVAEICVDEERLINDGRLMSLKDLLNGKEQI